MTTSNRAILKFNTNAETIVRLSIPRAYMDKTPEAAAATMEAILATNAVVTSAGVPRTIRSAKILQTTRESLM